MQRLKLADEERRKRLGIYVLEKEELWLRSDQKETILLVWKPFSSPQFFFGGVHM